MLRFRVDPGPCPIDQAPHHTCTAPPTDVIVAGLIRQPTSIVVAGPPSASASAPLEEPAPPSSFRTSTYRGTKKSPPVAGG